MLAGSDPDYQSIQIMKLIAQVTVSDPHCILKRE